MYYNYCIYCVVSMYTDQDADGYGGVHDVLEVPLVGDDGVGVADLLYCQKELGQTLLLTEGVPVGQGRPARLEAQRSSLS